MQTPEPIYEKKKRKEKGGKKYRVDAGTSTDFSFVFYP